MRSELDQLARRISATQDALETALKRGHRRRRNARLIAIVVGLSVGTGGVAAAFLAFRSPGVSTAANRTGPASSGSSSKASARAPQPASSPVTTSVTVGGATFTASAYSDTSGPCVTVSADGGSLGGCGTSDGPFVVGEGGLRVNGQLYNIAYGLKPAGASQMEVVLGDGSTVIPDTSNGVWLTVVPSTETSTATDFRSVRATDTAGNVLGQVTLPSLGEIRGNATGHSPTPVRASP